MKNTVIVRIAGTEADVNGFLRSLGYTPEIEVVESTKTARPLESDHRFGQVELVDVLVSFATSLAAEAAIMAVKAEFQRYQQGRPHMELEESPDLDESPDPGPTELDAAPDSTP